MHLPKKAFQNYIPLPLVSRSNDKRRKVRHENKEQMEAFFLILRLNRKTPFGHTIKRARMTSR